MAAKVGLEAFKTHPGRGIGEILGRDCVSRILSYVEQDGWVRSC